MEPSDQGISSKEKNGTSSAQLRRVDSLRFLLRLGQLKESFAISIPTALGLSFLAGSQAAATALIALPLLAVSQWSDLLGFAALGAPVALFGRSAPRGGRTAMIFQSALIQVIAVFLMSVASWLIEPLFLRLMILAFFSGLVFFVAASAGLGLPGPLIFVFTASASLGAVESFGSIIEHTAATGIVAGLALLICWMTESIRAALCSKRSAPPELEPFGSRALAAVRVGLGAAVAVILAYSFGAAHPGWAAVGLVAVMQGTQLHINMNRAVQRSIGTACGALVAWPILACQPSIWLIIAILALLMFLTEVIIGWNYALGQLSVTPMALLMTQLPSPSATTAALLPERILDTLLGASVAIVTAVICSRLEDRLQLAKRQVRSKD